VEGEGKPLSGGAWGRRSKASLLYHLPRTLPPTPFHGTLRIKPKQDFQSPTGIPPPSFYPVFVPRDISQSPASGPSLHPGPTHIPSPCPLAGWLPFLLVSIWRNFGHSTSTVCPGAEGGQQLMLSHSASQPVGKSHSTGLDGAEDKGHRPQHLQPFPVPPCLSGVLMGHFQVPSRH
jgi:hypothetical protein